MCHWRKGPFTAFGKHCDQRLTVVIRRQLYQVLGILLADRETWSIKDPHFAQLASFRNRYARSMCGLTLWHCRIYKVSNDNVLIRSTSFSTIHALLAWTFHDQHSKLSLFKRRGCDQKQKLQLKTHTVNMKNTLEKLVLQKKWVTT